RSSTRRPTGGPIGTCPDRSILGSTRPTSRGTGAPEPGPRGSMVEQRPLKPREAGSIPAGASPGRVGAEELGQGRRHEFAGRGHAGTVLLRGHQVSAGVDHGVQTVGRLVGVPGGKGDELILQLLKVATNQVQASLIGSQPLHLSFSFLPWRQFPSWEHASR